MSINTQPVTINLGPQHPSTHGVFRLRVTFDGEQVVDVEPVFGYLHRGTEKLAEERNYVQIVTLTDRLDYVAAMTNNLAYVRAVESLAGINVPDRGMYLRVISAELQRIASHLIATGFLLDELGAFHTPLIYCFRERERILELFEMLCGARITVSYMRPGGVFQDAPTDFWPRLDDFLNSMPGYLDELEGLITENEVDKLVVGIPYNMKGEDTKQTLKVKEFISFLESNLLYDIELIDERLSSIEAEKTMHKMNIKTGHNKSDIDKIAASVILQEYLDSYHD